MNSLRFPTHYHFLVHPHGNKWYFQKKRGKHGGYENSWGGRLKDLGERTCLLHIKEDVRKGEQDLVFSVVCEMTVMNAFPSEDEMMARGLEAILLSSEFCVYLMSRMGVERKQAWDLNRAPQQPGSHQGSVLSHLASSLHLYPVTTLSLALASSSQPRSLLRRRIPPVESGLLTRFMWSAQIWMSLGRTHIIQFAACSVMMLCHITCLRLLLVPWSSQFSSPEWSPDPLAQSIKACLRARLPSESRDFALLWGPHKWGWPVTSSLKFLFWPEGRTEFFPFSCSFSTVCSLHGSVYDILLILSQHKSRT